MAKIKIIDKTQTAKRYGDLAAGECFYACGDIAIKTANEWAVVLKDGNYVRRNDDDFVEAVEYAELYVGKSIKENAIAVEHPEPISDSICRYLRESMDEEYCIAVKDYPSVVCNGLSGKCECGFWAPNKNQ